MSDALFEHHFAALPQVTATAHGRANLIGDHTDYNNGFVLPCLLTHQTSVSISLTEEGMITGVSEEFGLASRPLDQECDGQWLDFISGALAVLTPYGLDGRGIQVAVSSAVPAGAGVSSSAALEIALLRALVKAAGLTDIAPKDMAKIAQKIEHDFIGTQCGIMDQMVVSVARPGQAMVLDCQSHDIALVEFFPSAVLMVFHSGSGRKLSEGLYNTRLSECQMAAQALNLPSLRQANLTMLDQLTDPIALQRARHVISENQRVQDAVIALKADEPEMFGALMVQSHQSLAKDYEVSSPVLDQLVQTCLDANALGARLTGAGFGGCVVALVKAGDEDRILAAVSQHCPKAYLVDVISA